MRENELVKDIAEMLNRHNAEIGSDTPDFILAAFMVSCLMSFDAAVKARSDWYGRHDEPGKCPVETELKTMPT